MSSKAVQRAYNHDYMPAGLLYLLPGISRLKMPQIYFDMQRLTLKSLLLGLMTSSKKIAKMGLRPASCLGRLMQNVSNSTSYRTGQLASITQECFADIVGMFTKGGRADGLPVIKPN